MEAAADEMVVPEASSPNNDAPNVPDGEQPNGLKSQKSRHRASVACASCRERRIRVGQLVCPLRLLLMRIVCCTSRRGRVRAMQTSWNRMYHQER